MRSYFCLSSISFNFSGSSLGNVNWIYYGLWCYVCKNVESLQDIYEHGYEKRGKYIMISIISLLTWNNHRLIMCIGEIKLKKMLMKHSRLVHISLIPTSFYDLKEN